MRRSRLKGCKDFKHLSATQIAWLAGLLEGEGCFGFTRAGAGKPAPAIDLQMSDEDTIATVSKLVQRRYHASNRPTPRLTMYRLRVSGDPAANLMRTVRPYMHERRTAKIDEVLDKHSKAV